jgi:5-methyltetrahydrofolate--homocysteine methyltransferase
MTTTLSSRNGVLEFGLGRPTLLINDQLRVIDQSLAVLAELREGRFDKLLELARLGQAAGLGMVDILVAHHDLDEVALLPRIAAAVHDEIGCPISLDTRNPQALEAALASLQPYKALLNSVSAEKDILDTLLPIAARYGAAVVGIPIGDSAGIPETPQARIAETQVILAAAQAHGIPREDVVIDAICLASAVAADSMQVTLQTLKVLSEDLGLTTILGIGNAGHGMPNQTVIDLAYLLAAIPCGLHAALVNPATAGLVDSVLAMDFLTSRDPYGARYIARYRAGQRAKKHGN